MNRKNREIMVTEEKWQSTKVDDDMIQRGIFDASKVFTITSHSIVVSELF